MGVDDGDFFCSSETFFSLSAPTSMTLVAGFGIDSAGTAKLGAISSDNGGDTCSTGFAASTRTFCVGSSCSPTDLLVVSTLAVDASSTAFKSRELPFCKAKNDVRLCGVGTSAVILLPFAVGDAGDGVNDASVGSVMTGKAEEREDRLAAAAAAAAANVVVSVTAADDAVGIGSGGTSAEPGSSGVVSLRSSSLAAIPMAVVVAAGPAFLFSEKLDFRRYLLNSLSAAEGCRVRVGSCAVEGDGSGVGNAGGADCAAGWEKGTGDGADATDASGGTGVVPRGVVPRGVET